MVILFHLDSLHFMANPTGEPDGNPSGQGAGTTPRSEQLSENDKERAHQRAMARAGLIADVIKMILTAFIVVGCVFFLTEAIKAFAGTDSTADIDLPIDSFAPWITTAITAGWAASERRFRKRDTDRFTRRIRQLEEIVDENRSSLQDAAKP